MIALYTLIPLFAGFIVLYECFPTVTTFYPDKTRKTMVYRPAVAKIGKNNYELKMKCTYYYNNTGKNLYVTRVGYGDKMHEPYEIVFILRKGQVTDNKYVQQSRFFKKIDRFAFLKGNETGKYHYYLDF